MHWEWILDETNCTGCGICVDLCAEHAIVLTRDMAFPEPVPSACVGCLVCVQECPFGAIEVRSLSTVPVD
jgi:MinD superfamily P-loop ATPase